MGVWFALLAVTGLREVVMHPGILRAASPTYAVAFLLDHGTVGFLALGSVVLTVTGAEALYADMGHFGRPADPAGVVHARLPGAGAELRRAGRARAALAARRRLSPSSCSSRTGRASRSSLLATLATVIASQAVISGAFSVTRQAVQLGFLPRLVIRHTSRSEVGQVYVPAVNWGLFVAVVALVVGFGSSARLASAYGIAVTGTLAIDTLLFFCVVRGLWRKPLWLAVGGAAGFLVVDLAFLAANVPKVLHGGWFPLVVAAGVFTIMSTWQRGRTIVTRNRAAQEGPLQDFVDHVHALRPPVHRSPGTGCSSTPTGRRRRWRCGRTSSTTRSCTAPSSSSPSRCSTSRTSRPGSALSVDDLGFGDDGISHLTARFGFQDDIDLPAALRLARGRRPGGVRRPRRAVLVPVEDGDRPDARPRDGPVAQAPLPGALAQRRQPGGLLRAAVDRVVVMGSQIEL